MTKMMMKRTIAKKGTTKRAMFVLLILMFVIASLMTGCTSTTSTADPASTTGTTGTTGTAATAGTADEQAGKGTPGGGGMEPGKIDTSAIKTQYVDVAYGSVSDTQKLDIYLPNEGDGPFPVIVAIHGGGFMMGSSTGGDVAAMLEGANRGYAVVSINYRMSGEAIFPAAVNDCKAAIRFIKANASKYGLAPDKIAVWGDSAGGNLAAMVGTTGAVEALNGDNKENLEYTSSVQAVVDWFGPLDFLKMDEQMAASGITPKMGKTSSDSSPESRYIGQLITNDPALTAKANPATYVSTLTAETAPAFLIQHGTADANVPYQQSSEFAELLKKSIGEEKVNLKLLDGAGHGTSEFTTEENLNVVFDFLDSKLK